jgi:hypothetical protein
MCWKLNTLEKVESTLYVLSLSSHIESLGFKVTSNTLGFSVYVREPNTDLGNVIRVWRAGNSDTSIQDLVKGMRR